MLLASIDPVPFQGATHIIKLQLHLTLICSMTSLMNSTKSAHCCGGSFRAGPGKENENPYTEEVLNVSG